MGKIITFYSYKGGVGRSMSLANIGVLLARWGYKVLMVDFDLEAPGLENFFTRAIEIERAQKALGVVDLLIRASMGFDGIELWSKSGIPIRLPRISGDLQLLTAGERSSEYFKHVRSLDFADFYSTKSGGAVIEQIRRELKSHYDFVLIDSRTGLTEIGGVCTVQLPDSIVLMFTATNQGFFGGIDIVKRATSARQRLPYQRPLVPTIPVPSRLDIQSEFRLSQQWLDTFSRDLEPIFAEWLPKTTKARTVLEMLKLPHISFFSYGETLPVLDHGTTDPAGLGYAYETLTAVIANGLQDIEVLIADRNEYVRKASRNRPEIVKESARANIFVSYSHRDLKWVERLRVHLSPLLHSRALSLWDDSSIRLGENWREQLTNALSKADVAVLLVSPDYLASDFVTAVELPELLRAAENNGLKVVWVALKPSLFAETSIASFQALNNPSKPLSTMSGSEQDNAWVSLVEKISSLAGRSF